MPEDFVLGDPNKKKPTIGGLPQPSAPGPQIPGPVAEPDHVLGNGQKIGAPPAPQFPLGNGQPPAAGATPQPPPQVGGSADFPSLPAGAVPPPGYVDPVTGKSAGGPPSAPGPQVPGPIAQPIDMPASPAAPAAAAPAEPSPYKDALVKLLNDGGKTADLTDPALKAQSDAFAVGQTRAAERAQEAGAERLAAQGLSSSGASDANIAGILENQGANQSGFNAQLVGDANKQNLQKLTTALSMMGNDINSAEGRALQERIANMQAQIQKDQMAQQNSQFGVDADLRKLGITTQADLGGQDLRLRDKLGSGQLQLGLLGQLIGNQNFNSGLGAQMGQFNAGLNQQAILAMLGGL